MIPNLYKMYVNDKEIAATGTKIPRPRRKAMRENVHKCIRLSLNFGRVHALR